MARVPRRLIDEADHLATRLWYAYLVAAGDRPRQRRVRDAYFRASERLRRREGKPWERLPTATIASRRGR